MRSRPKSLALTLSTVAAFGGLVSTIGSAGVLIGGLAYEILSPVEEQLPSFIAKTRTPSQYFLYGSIAVGVLGTGAYYWFSAKKNR